MTLPCIVFGLWCAAGTPVDGWKNKIVSGPRIPDVIIKAGVCSVGENNAIRISAAIAIAERIQQTTPPTSDAAAFSTEGAIVEVRLPPGTCAIWSPIEINAGIPITIVGTGTTLDAQNSLASIFLIRQQRQR